MATAQAVTKPVVEEVDDIFEEVDTFEGRGDWTAERHEILDVLSKEEITAELLKLQEEYSDTLTVKTYI